MVNLSRPAIRFANFVILLIIISRNCAISCPISSYPRISSGEVSTAEDAIGCSRLIEKSRKALGELPSLLDKLNVSAIQEPIKWLKGFVESSENANSSLANLLSNYQFLIANLSQFTQPWLLGGSNSTVVLPCNSTNSSEIICASPTNSSKISPQSTPGTTLTPAKTTTKPVIVDKTPAQSPEFYAGGGSDTEEGDSDYHVNYSEFSVDEIEIGHNGPNNSILELIGSNGIIPDSQLKAENPTLASPLPTSSTRKTSLTTKSLPTTITSTITSTVALSTSVASENGKNSSKNAMTEIGNEMAVSDGDQEEFEIYDSSELGPDVKEDELSTISSLNLTSSFNNTTQTTSQSPETKNITFQTEIFLPDVSNDTTTQMPRNFTEKTSRISGNISTTEPTNIANSTIALLDTTVVVNVSSISPVLTTFSPNVTSSESTALTNVTETSTSIANQLNTTTKKTAVNESSSSTFSPNGRTGPVQHRRHKSANVSETFETFSSMATIKVVGETSAPYKTPMSDLMGLVKHWRKDKISTPKTWSKPTKPPRTTRILEIFTTIITSKMAVTTVEPIPDYEMTFEEIERLINEQIGKGGQIRASQSLDGGDEAVRKSPAETTNSVTFSNVTLEANSSTIVESTSFSTHGRTGPIYPKVTTSRKGAEISTIISSPNSIVEYTVVNSVNSSSSLSTRGPSGPIYPRRESVQFTSGTVSQTEDHNLTNISGPVKTVSSPLVPDNQTTEYNFYNISGDNSSRTLTSYLLETATTVLSSLKVTTSKPGGWMTIDEKEAIFPSDHQVIQVWPTLPQTITPTQATLRTYITSPVVKEFIPYVPKRIPPSTTRTPLGPVLIANSRGFFVIENVGDYKAARAACSSRHGKLAVIKNKLDHIAAVSFDVEYGWIGLFSARNPRKAFIWNDGTSYNASQFSPKPVFSNKVSSSARDCVAYWHDLSWRSLPCSQSSLRKRKMKAVCQLEKFIVCNKNGKTSCVDVNEASDCKYMSIKSRNEADCQFQTGDGKQQCWKGDTCICVDSFNSKICSHSWHSQHWKSRTECEQQCSLLVSLFPKSMDAFSDKLSQLADDHLQDKSATKSPDQQKQNDAPDSSNKSVLGVVVVVAAAGLAGGGAAVRYFKS